MRTIMDIPFWTTAYERLKKADMGFAGEIDSEYYDVDPVTSAIVIPDDKGKGNINWDNLENYAKNLGYVVKKKENGTITGLFRFDRDIGYYVASDPSVFTDELIRAVKSFRNTLISTTFPKLVELNIIKNLPSTDELIPKGRTAALIDLYKDGEVIPFKNGIYSVRANRMLPRTSSVFIENPLMVDFNPDSLDADIAERYMQIACGDQSVLYDLLEQCGYIFFSRKITQPSFVIFSGPAGANGKSTVIKVIKHIIREGDISYTSLMGMTDKFAQTEMIGKILNIAEDTSSISMDQKFMTSNVLQFLKNATDGAEQQFERKYEKPFFTTAPKKFIFATNYNLNFGGTDGGFERRMHIIPFDNRFKSDNSIQDLYLEKEAVEWFAMNSLVAYMCFVHRGCSIKGVDEFEPNAPLTGVFFESKRSQKAKVEQLMTQDSVMEWLGDYLNLDVTNKMEVVTFLVLSASPDAGDKRMDPFEEYVTYCSRNHRKNKSRKSFHEELEKRFDLEISRSTSSILNGSHYYRYDVKNGALLMGINEEEE